MGKAMNLAKMAAILMLAWDVPTLAARDCTFACVGRDECTNNINGAYDGCTIGKDYQGVRRCVNGIQCGKPPQTQLTKRKEELAGIGKNKPMKACSISI